MLAGNPGLFRCSRPGPRGSLPELGLAVSLHPKNVWSETNQPVSQVPQTAYLTIKHLWRIWHDLFGTDQSHTMRPLAPVSLRGRSH
jgi:hypothetical protein